MRGRSEDAVGVLERVARWIWLRRRWDLWVALVLTVLGLVTAGIPAVLTATSYLDLDRGQSVRFLLATALVVSVAIPLTLLTSGRGAFSVIEDWRTGGRASASAVAGAAFGDFHALLMRVGGVVTLIVLLTVVPLGASFTESRLAAYAALGLGVIVLVQWAIAIMDAATELLLRPVREELASSGVGIGASGQRSVVRRMTTAAFLAAWACGATTGATVILFDSGPGRLAAGVGISVVLGAIYTVLVVRIGVITPSLRPLDDLVQATTRVASGHYTSRIPVTSNDDLARLVSSFNAMQAGLVERERLQAAFGSYVDPALARRLLTQGDDIFSGNRVEVTVMFVDIRDFTPFAEANPAETTVALLNDLFTIVVTTSNDHRGHVNKFLGDGALVVFGAPERSDDHAHHALAAAADIQRRVSERFDEGLRIGIGINTGTVLAGTIGGAGKLEFTLIGDAVNIAARVEQLTKTTGDHTLVTQATVDALPHPPANVVHRGAHVLRGKAEPITIHALAAREPTPT